MSNFAFAGSNWEFKFLKYQGEHIRAGILRHTNSEYKGTIMYLQGLGDSMLNHAPLFNFLNKHGHNIISFDYMGQGGSTGKMNSTRIHNINELSEIVWAQFEAPKKKKILLGWSTGGLAAYRYAYKYPDKTQAVILLAPGISPKMMVGESSNLACFMGYGYLPRSCKLLAITKASLTQNLFSNTEDPHIDKIKPDSPLDVPSFATNLLATAVNAKSWVISTQVKGMVYLSSDDDTYVDANKTIEILSRNARHFEHYQFGHGALHELDNELDIISNYLRKDILRFLNEI